MDGCAFFCLHHFSFASQEPARGDTFLHEVGETARGEGVAVGVALNGIEIAAVDVVTSTEGGATTKPTRGNERVESEEEPLCYKLAVLVLHGSVLVCW